MMPPGQSVSPHEVIVLNGIDQHRRDRPRIFHVRADCPALAGRTGYRARQKRELRSDAEETHQPCRRCAQ